MKVELIRYRSLGVDFLAVIKNELVIDIACSDKVGTSTLGEPFLSEEILRADLQNYAEEETEIQVKDLALYTHWPVHTKEFWDLYFESCLDDA